jgi:hypothetical protein
MGLLHGHLTSAYARFCLTVVSEVHDLEQFGYVASSESGKSHSGVDGMEEKKGKVEKS